MLDTLRQAIRQALDQQGLTADQITLEQPARRSHGDLSCNVALALASAAQMPPRELAQSLAEQLRSAGLAHIDHIDIAGPGFINFRFSDSWWQSVVRQVLEQGPDGYARLDLGQGDEGQAGEGQADEGQTGESRNNTSQSVRVNLEFISANPTGPLHAGHARGAALGDALGRILRRCGYEVSTEFYVNDQGRQLDLFTESLRAAEAGETVPEDGYQGDYVAEWARRLDFEAGDLKQQALDLALDDQKRTLARLDIGFDRWFKESEMVVSGAAQSLLERMLEQDKAYVSDGATWLRVSDFGDSQDRVLVKSSGELTYLTPDIAYHTDKLARADHLIDIWGADHHDYVTRLKAALKAAGQQVERLEIITCQIVKLMRAGDEVKLAKRSGDLITIDELVDEIGSDAVKFAYLQQTPDSHLSVDLDVLRESSMDNPVYYVQYAHVRAAAILRQAPELGGTDAAPADLTLLTHERELELMRQLAELPNQLRAACQARAPHKIVAWLRDMAGAFHGFYHDCRVTGDDVPAELGRARLSLVKASQVALAIGLDLVGVSAPERM